MCGNACTFPAVAKSESRLLPPFPAAKSGGKAANQTDDVTVK
jgi:hypothetical protein